MSWNGKNFNRPLIMLDYAFVQDVIEKNAYEPDEDVESLIYEHMTSEKLILLLRSKGMLKEACDFMSYCINRRVGVWWAYSCVEAVNLEIEEQKKICPLSEQEQFKKEAKEKIADLADKSEINEILAKLKISREKFISDMETLAGPKITDSKNPLFQVQEAIREKQEQQNIKSTIEEMENALNNAPPEKLSKAKRIIEKAFLTYEQKNGIHPLEQLKNEIKKSICPEPLPENTELRDKYVNAIKGRCQEVKDFIKKTVNETFPLKISGMPKKMSPKRAQDAMFAIKRWVLTPTDENGRTAFLLGKKICNTPEGLCAVSSFWAGTDLVPEQKEKVFAPPGLLANGLRNVIFMCAKKRGGSKSYDERYEEYFNIGIDCLTGVRTWDKEWKKKTPTVKGKLNDELDSKSGFGRH
ncbi:hypothetical protein P0136_09280 [Lentisphaerota bacterium ZTH]|nr:hypothetical protein JYG24_13210 [Lentisphaerota bacterium]WET05555.1 hypothetical protein P0136_09280 [Lentisphaerota bacterium ZTH]